jgi:hypothetical protein
MVYDVGKNCVSSQPAAPVFWMTVALEFPESDKGFATSDPAECQMVPFSTAS